MENYGDVAWKLPECANVVKSQVKKLVPLINAPRRLPDGPVRTALAILIESDSPKAALVDERLARRAEGQITSMADTLLAVGLARHFSADRLRSVWRRSAGDGKRVIAKPSGEPGR